MQHNPLDSAKAKVDRAKYHLHQLKSELAGRNVQAHGLSSRYESQTGDLVVAFSPPRDLLTHYSIVAGEIVGQARSALEHAVWELTPNPILGKTGFPVFTAKTKGDAARQGKDRYYDSEVLRILPGINVNAIAIIETLQPFGSDYATHPLYILNELWNRDKHRLLATCVALVIAIQLHLVHPNGVLETIRIDVPPYLKDDTELFRGRHPNVDVGMEVGHLGIVFDDGLVKGKPIVELLHKLVEFAERVVNDLAATI